MVIDIDLFVDDWLHDITVELYMLTLITTFQHNRFDFFSKKDIFSGLVAMIGFF